LFASAPNLPLATIVACSHTGFLDSLLLLIGRFLAVATAWESRNGYLRSRSIVLHAIGLREFNKVDLVSKGLCDVEHKGEGAQSLGSTAAVSLLRDVRN
jgi:hypothetical protein